MDTGFEVMPIYRLIEDVVERDRARQMPKQRIM